MLGLANVNKTVEEVRQHLENGQALAKFEEMVQAQGGDLEDLYRPVNVAHVVEIPAQETVSFQLFQLWTLVFMP